jgi:AcrR family transcriptional regulator
VAGSIWARPVRSGRGPDPTYSREQITEAAIKIADAEGIEAVSMRRIAREVSAGAMSLYRYLGSKDDLIELMTDAVLGEDPLPDDVDGWREGMLVAANRMRAITQRHPWLATLNPGRPTFGPNTLVTMEASLRYVDGLGLTIDEMLNILLSVTGFVRGFMQSELGEAEAVRRTKLSEQEWRLSQADYIQQILDDGRFPLVAKVIRDAALPHMDLDEQFRTGLNHLLDGIAAKLDR